MATIVISCPPPPVGPGNLVTPLLPVCSLLPVRLSPTIEYVTICSAVQLQSSSGMFLTSDSCRSLFFVRYSNASKNHILVSNTRPLHSAARRSVSRLEHHTLLHCGAILGPRVKTWRCTSVCCMSKVEDVLESRQVIKYNTTRRLYNQ